MTPTNNGKRFEQNFKSSVPNDVFCYRFKDGTANFMGARNANVRFQAYNMCDFLLYNGNKLFLLELKAHKGKSLPISCIRKNQIEELSKASLFTNIVAGVLVYFVDVEEVYFLSIDILNYFLCTEKRKSIPLDFFKKEGKRIPCNKKEINIILNLNNLLNL